MNAIVKIAKAQPFEPERAAQLCAHLANGFSLEEACELIGADGSTVWRWRQAVPSFAKSYADAKTIQLDRYADQIVPLADSSLGMDSAGVQATKTMVDARKWMLSKLMSHVYGDKLDVTSKGEALAAPSHQIDARVQSIIMQAEQRRLSSLSHEALSLLD